MAIPSAIETTIRNPDRPRLSAGRGIDRHAGAAAGNDPVGAVARCSIEHRADPDPGGLAAVGARRPRRDPAAAGHSGVADQSENPDAAARSAPRAGTADGERRRRTRHAGGKRLVRHHRARDAPRLRRERRHHLHAPRPPVQRTRQPGRAQRIRFARHGPDARPVPPLLVSALSRIRRFATVGAAACRGRRSDRQTQIRKPRRKPPTACSTISRVLRARRIEV